MKIKIERLTEFTFIGLAIKCLFSELHEKIPILWQAFEQRKSEIPNHLATNHRIGLFLGRQDDLFHEAVGMMVPADADVPQGMIKVTVPSYAYAIASHRGLDVQSSYQTIYTWISENGYQTIPQHEPFHHFECYPKSIEEPNQDNALNFDIYIRLLSGKDV